MTGYFTMSTCMLQFNTIFSLFTYSIRKFSLDLGKTLLQPSQVLHEAHVKSDSKRPLISYLASAPKKVVVIITGIALSSEKTDHKCTAPDFAGQEYSVFTYSAVFSFLLPPFALM